MKKIISAVAALLLTSVCFLFALNVIFKGQLNGNSGFFYIAGSVYSGYSVDAINSSGLSLINTLFTGDKPKVRYIGGVRAVGDVINVKELFEVQLASGEEYKPGTSEDGFSLCFDTVTSLEGSQVVEIMSSERIAGIQEIPASFVYDYEQDLLYFFHSGTYRISVRVYTKVGHDVLFDVIVPVEVGGSA